MIILKVKKLLRKLLANDFSVQNIDFQSGLGDSAWLLYGLTRSLKPKVCVEIGSARGKSTCFIGLALKHNGNGKLYAIDAHDKTKWNDFNSVDTFDIINQNLQMVGVKEYVEIVRSFSNEAEIDWSKPIDMLFIDGDHSYNGVKADWERFVPRVSEFGVVIFHDTLWDLRPDPKWNRPDMGVPRFVEELRIAGYPVVTIDKDCGVSIVQPTKGGNMLSLNIVNSKDKA